MSTNRRIPITAGIPLLTRSWASERPSPDSAVSHAARISSHGLHAVRAATRSATFRRTSPVSSWPAKSAAVANARVRTPADIPPWHRMCTTLGLAAAIWRATAGALFASSSTVTPAPAAAARLSTACSPEITCTLAPSCTPSGLRTASIRLSS